jgi:lysosomal acid lipase/cholesteryl ester hydrolase
MIKRRGYKAETHSVTTKDGYVLQMHRIPSVPPRGEPVFLQHGLLSSSADWVEMGPDSGLGNDIFVTSFECWVTFFNLNSTMWIQTTRPKLKTVAKT